MKRLCIDTGGTFTDCLVLGESGALRQFKASTTPDAPERGLLDAVNKAARAYGLGLREFLGQVELLVLGTTLATNAVLTKRGARTGMITTKNFRDIIEIRRGIRGIENRNMYNQVLPPYKPLVPRYMRRGVEERTLANGEVLTPLNEQECREAAAFLGKLGVGALAIGFLHCYANPTNERRAAEICREVLPNVYITTSHEILPVWREFERFSTTVVSAYVGPIIERFLTKLDTRLREEGFTGQLLVVTSNSLVQTIEECVRQAVFALNSGPAAAPTGAIEIGSRVGERDLVSVDMGGTSFDVGLIRNAEVPTTTENWVGEERVATKMVDVHSVGAGGGSIAWIDLLGVLRVGPQSAGADPGPACYGKGNEQPTVTDADVVLGYVPTDYFLGGEMTLDCNLAEQAVARLAEKLGLGLVETASSIFTTVNATMANQIHELSTMRGHDLRELTLVAGGGAGPVHAAFLARQLGIRKVIVPPVAALYSAYGMTAMDLGRDYARSYVVRLGLLDSANIDRLYWAMEEEALANFAGPGVSADQVVLSRSCELRYNRQFHELEVPVRSGPVEAELVNEIVDTFHKRHEASYKFSMPGQDIEFLTFRVKALVPHAPVQPQILQRGDSDASALVKRRRSCWFDNQEMDTPVYDGDRLLAGNQLVGPAIVEERTTTVVIPPGFMGEVDEYKNYLLHAGVPTQRGSAGGLAKA
ncbi:MAG: hydantoinase/oxoprolinase family protein [Deltaproteobacteria bacterium]|nr:hydantoinase/oxoprolinase family protein [Deltaproteobacteria bacterium]